MSDWQVGDLAVCVDAELRTYSSWPRSGRLVVGRSYSVRGFRVRNCDGGLNLLMVGENAEGLGWAEDRFRKIRPDKHEACEDEFITLLKRRKVAA